ncbi:MAG: hypothetical protein HY290_27340 [Planctomycetia bacterium]|nr:hypothetical protein [Planctomycetia bacterium]
MRTISTLAVLFAMVVAAPGAFAQTSGAKSKGKSLKDGITTYGDPPIKGGAKSSPTSTGKKPPVTSITVELLTGNDGLGLKARNWVDILGKLDVVVTVRNGRADDKLGVTEDKGKGVLRTVRVVGALDSKGRLVFPDQTFTEDETAKLAAWLKELRVYGAQGDPGSQPVWGLTKEQFGVIHTALKRPLDAETKDVPVASLLPKFDVPKQHPIALTTSAVQRLKERGERARVSQSLTGISQGTALAVLLAEQGLGFRPRRLPDGMIELTVAPLDEAKNAWPVGWPRVKEIPELAPTLFQFKTIDLDEEPLDRILEAVAGQIKLPILIDRAGLEAKDVDLAEVKITYPFKKTTWITALKEFTFKAKAKVEVLIDEAGVPFLWITPLDAPSREQKG